MSAHCISTKSTEHSPLPWKVFEGDDVYRGIESADDESVVIYGSGDDDGGVRGDTPEQALANAAFIVRAVNSHDALVKALEDTKGRIMNAKMDLALMSKNACGIALVYAITEIDAALAKVQP